MKFFQLKFEGAVEFTSLTSPIPALSVALFFLHPNIYHRFTLEFHTFIDFHINIHLLVSRLI